MIDESNTYDVIVLGTGPAGSTVAKKCAEGGASVLVVESRKLGGTCALRGCNPKEVLALAAGLVDAVRSGDGKLVRGEAELDWATVRRFADEFTGPVPDATRDTLDELGIDWVIGRPAWLDTRRLRVGERELRADAICIAVGAEPIRPDLPGADLGITSDEFLELDELPQRLVFAGGGYVAMEFAHVAIRAGVSVRVMERSPMPLQGFDGELVEQLVERSRELGIEFDLETELVAIERTDDGLRVRGNGPSGDAVGRRCDAVVLALGRRPAIDVEALSGVGIVADESGVAVDESGSSVSADGVFAAGDCASTTLPPLTMSASIQGECVAHSILRRLGRGAGDPKFDVDPMHVPRVVFTTPRLASVGRTELEARESSSGVVVESGSWERRGFVRKRGVSHAGYKVIVDEASDHIVGAHFLGPGADDLVNLCALAMQCGITATSLRSSVYAFPSVGSELPGALPSIER